MMVISIIIALAAPNPIHPGAAFGFELPSAARARLAVYDAGGRRVRALVDAPLAAGRHQATWDGRDEAGALAPAGLYFLRFDAGDRSLTRRIALLR